MKKASDAQTWVLRSICVLLASQLLFWPWSRWVTRDLVREPVVLGEAIVIERDIRVPTRETYELSFDFERRAGSEDIRDYLDGRGYLMQRWPATRKPVIPVEWRLTDAGTHRVVASGSQRTVTLSSYSTDTARASIAYFRVAPGAYRLDARILPPEAPELHGIAPTFRVALPGGKGASTWQLGLVFWGSIASVLIIGPLVLVLAGMMMWWSRSRSNRRVAQ